MTDLHADAMVEGVKTLRPALACVGIALVVLGLAYGGGYWHGAKVTARKASASEAQAIEQANQAKGERDAITKLAQAKDAQIADREYRLAESRAKVARTVAELAAYRAAHPAEAAPADLPGESLQPRVDELAGLVRKQDAVIQAQDETIHLQDVEIADLTISRDLHKARADAADRESLNLRAALAAKDGLIRAAEIKGFCWGLGFGAATGGYAGYRVGRR